MTSKEVSKHIKDAAWDKAEESVRSLSDKILNIENKKEEKKQMKKIKKDNKKKQISQDVSDLRESAKGMLKNMED